MEDLVWGIARFNLDAALQSFFEVGMEKRHQVLVVFVTASQEEPVEFLCVIEFKRQFRRIIEVIVESGGDVSFDPLGFVSLPSSFPHFAGNIPFLAFEKGYLCLL